MRRARGCGGRFLTTKKIHSTAATNNKDTVTSDHKNVSPNLSGSADSISGCSSEIVNSASNGNKDYSCLHGFEFELSGYQSLSGDNRGNQGDFSRVPRPLTIK